MLLRPVLLAIAVITFHITPAQQRYDRTLEWGEQDGIQRTDDLGRNVSDLPGVSKGSNKEGPTTGTRSVQPFKGAFLDMDRGGMPYYHEVLDLSSNTTKVMVSLADPTYAALSVAERSAWGDMEGLGPDPEVVTGISWYRKQPKALVSVYPFRRSPVTGAYEKLISFQLVITGTTDRNGVGVRKDYPANSKLSSGQWYRFTVSKDGVHVIDHAFLSSLGVDMNGLSSDAINVYGNHHGLLPFQNDVPRATDLRLNAIQVEDGGDGQFGPGDRILFHASGAQRWDLVDGKFRQTKNVYTDSASYFIGIGVDPPARIMAADLSSDPATHAVTRFNDRQHIEKDLVNLIKSGRTYYGELFDIILTYNFNFETPFLAPDEPANITFNGTARTLGTTNSSGFTITSGLSLNNTFNVLGVGTSYTGLFARPFEQMFEFQPSGNNVPLTVTFTKHNPVTSLGWMNYLTLNCRRELRMIGDQLSFRDLASIGPGNVAEFVVDQAQSVHRIWEITDPAQPRNVEFSDVAGQKVFRVRTDSLRQFISFRNGGYLIPTAIGPVQNQDLHATAVPTDLVIVCPPEFMSQAQRLADQRMSEGLVVSMVTPQQVFNEFSSGSRDATAIKRFMRMLYDKAGTDPLLMPRYLLLFGDGSYNNISLAATNQNWIPSYQTADAVDPSKSYTSDDYFGLLDDNEGEWTGDLVDIGIGRLPVSSLQQAREVVDKMLNYDRLEMLSYTGDVCSATGDGGIPDWRTQVLFASDDQDGDGFEGWVHMSQSNQLAAVVENEHPEFNVNKVFLDAYQQISTPGGQRYPQASTELRERVQKGLLLVNYVGHGGEVGWAHERFLDNGTIFGWTNKDRLPLFMTATCEFSRWDDPGRTSAGEYVLLNAGGGGIGLMTTTRLAFSQANFQLSQRFYDHVFRETDDEGRSFNLGDIYRETKRDITTAQSNSTNHRNFALLGDPSMRLAISHHDLVISSITDTLGVPVDTIKALSTVRISGFIDDGSGQPMADFNGQVIPTVYDKELQVSTLANDGGTPFPFRIRKSTLYRGRATVTNGSFDFTFVVPKDINYEFGPGRISCYAESWSTNASGYSNDPIIGGTASDIAEDAIGPRIELFMNDESFVRGGMTDQSPLIFAKISDENGINTVGSSIGHDLLAVLNENSEQAIVLNDQYQADLDTYKSGSVRYRLSALEEGAHTLRLKAWDVFNNSSEATTEFVVASSAELALDHVLNYPNPFTTYTEFYFEHNRPCTSLNAQVQVFTVSGRLVKTINRQLTCQGYRSDALAWDGRDDFGDKLGRGVYVYQLSVTTSDGERAEKIEKLVILR